MTDPHEKIPMPALPWWRYGYMWMVVGGPAVVVVGCMVLAFLAINGADPLVDAKDDRRAIEINKQLLHERALLPAHQARNHAATPTREPQR